jgi:hypothetical protein
MIDPILAQHGSHLFVEQITFPNRPHHSLSPRESSPSSGPTHSSINSPSRMITIDVPVCRAISRARLAARRSAGSTPCISLSRSLDFYLPFIDVPPS